MPLRPDIELVAAHEAFVRRLARTLMSEADRAEDLAQDTWVAALEGRPAELRGPRGWLAAAMRGVRSKRLRSEAARAHRERLAARPEATDPLEEVLAREEARRALMDALSTLAEPYRTCLLLRYFEGLPPRRIARRLGVPVETVKTRLKRGREQLAARLDREFDGGRSAWALALVPLAGWGREPFTAGALLEMAIMSTRAKLVLGAGALAGLILATALGVLALRAAEPVAPAPGAAHLGFVPVESADAETPESALADAGPLGERAAAPPSAAAELPEEAPTRGSLAVRILRWDGTPAAAVRSSVLLFDVPSPAFHAIETVTDIDGRFFLAELLPGGVGIYPILGGGARARIEPGKNSEVLIELVRGFDLVGEVVDERGEPVARADILLSSMGPPAGSPVTSTDAAGHFRVASIEMMGWVGALAPGYAPSRLQTVMGGEGAQVPVQLVLDRRGGQVRGRVVDPAGEPVEGAVVLVGSDLGFAKAGWSPAPVRALTDAEGVYHVASVAPGDCDVAVRADGYAAWRGSVPVFEGAVSDQDVYLTAGADIHGFARDADGAPAVRVEIAVEVAEGLSYSVRSAADGSYRLEDVPAGRIEVRAEGDKGGRAAATLVAGAGEAVEWSFRLGTGLSMAGRVVDEAGNALAGWVVEIATTASEDGTIHNDRARTDADGRFRFPDCPDHTYRATATAPTSGFFPSVMLEGQRPPEENLLLRAARDRMPTCRISGTVATKDGGPAAAASVMLGSDLYNSSPIQHPDLDTGRFEFEGLPPGVWSVRVDFPGAPHRWSDSHDLQPGESWDAGTIVVGEQGTFRARLLREDGAGAGAPQAVLEFDGKYINDALELGSDAIRGGPVAPGRYTLSLFAEGCAASRHTFEVRDGEETALELPLRPGWPARITVDLGSSGRDARYGRLAVIDPSGETVAYTWIWLADGKGAQELWLAPGIHRVVLRLADGSTAEGSLEVRAGAEEIAVIALWP